MLQENNRRVASNGWVDGNGREGPVPMQLPLPLFLAFLEHVKN